MARNYSKCPHMENIVQLSLPELCKLKQGLPCSACKTIGPNLWICLYRQCLHTGCSEQANDHSTEHFKLNNLHCVHMNLSSQRIWCYLCETEVFLTQRRSSLASNNDSASDASRYSERIYDRNIGAAAGESPESSGDEDDTERGLMDGLVGLQNIANTCYMNAALQALSNSPPLTYYFLDCGDIIEASSDLSGNQRKPGLAKSYHRLIKDMWCRAKRGSSYVVPRGILYGIRSVHPMFRGFQQHDTQEFLRCFMDQLHEELKEVTPPPPDILLNSNYQSADERSVGFGSSTNDDDQSPRSTPSPSQSEAEYETCDSGVSEQSSLSDEISTNLNNRNTANKIFSSRSSSPTSNSSYITFASGKTSPQHHQQQQNQKDNNNSAPTKPPHRSIISDVFDGKLLSSVQCLTCNRVSTREETFQDLSLPIPGKDHLAVLHQSMSSTQLNQPQMINTNNTGSSGSVTCTDAVYQVGQDGWFWWVWNWFRSWFWGPAVSLHDCMAAFFSADELKGDNMYSCEQCNKLRNGIKYSRVLALPEMLCIHLKRFRHDLSYSSKISSPVNFPLTGLDMRQYLHKDCKSEISSYDLTAVICHHGTVGGGHYTSFAKHDLTGKWFEFDDQLVTEVTPDVVQNCQAYVLFYRKANPEMAIVRAQAQELAELHPPQASDIRFFVSRQWINRFNTFAEPGPIDNWAILCPHGGLPPYKAALTRRIAVPLPQPLWDFLYKKFGGGPACNRLFECDTCRRAAESLARRQDGELDAFTKFNTEFQYQDVPTTIYAISMAWFRQWQLFVRGVTTEEPGPINNTTIAASSETLPIRNVKPGSDYAQLNTNLWKFFHGIYGGGPEIILRGGPSEDAKQQKEKEIEAMEIDQEQHQQQPKVASTSVTKNQDSIEKTDTETNNENIEKTQSAKSIGKQSKNVSFEDDPEEICSENSYDKSSRSSKYDDETIVISSPTITTSQYHQNNHNNVNNISSNGRRGKYDIISKKDKKYRSAMKATSALFGPEGKYYTQSSIDNNIPEPTTTNTTTSINKNNNTDQTNSTTPNPISNGSNPNNFQTSSPPPITKNGSLMNSSQSNHSIPSKMNSPPMKRPITSSYSEEMEPFIPLQQTFQTPEENIDQQHQILTTTVELHQIEQLKSLNTSEMHVQKSLNANSSKSSILSRKFSSGVGKGHHRKKIKSKNNRKSSTTTNCLPQENCSDSC